MVGLKPHPLAWPLQRCLLQVCNGYLISSICSLHFSLLYFAYSLHLHSLHSLACLTVLWVEVVHALPTCAFALSTLQLAGPTSIWRAWVASGLLDFHLACSVSSSLLNCIEQVGLRLAGPAGILLACYTMCMLIYQDGSLSRYCACSLGISLPSLYIAWWACVTCSGHIDIRSWCLDCAVCVWLTQSMLGPARLTLGLLWVGHNLHDFPFCSSCSAWSWNVLLMLWPAQFTSGPTQAIFHLLNSAFCLAQS